MTKNLSGDVLYKILRSYDVNKLSENSNEYLIGKHLEKALESSGIKHDFMCGITHGLAPYNPVIIVVYKSEKSEETEEESSQIYGSDAIEQCNISPITRRPIVINLKGEKSFISVALKKEENLSQCFEEYRKKLSDEEYLNKLSDKEREEINKAKKEINKAIDGINDRLSQRLLKAVEEDNTDEAQKLIEAGANVFITDQSKYTLLHIAVRNANTVLVGMLIKEGANINLADNYKYTLLHVATKKNNPEMVSYLIEKGVDV